MQARYPTIGALDAPRDGVIRRMGMEQGGNVGPNSTGIHKLTGRFWGFGVGPGMPGHLGVHHQESAAEFMNYWNIPLIHIF